MSSGIPAAHILQFLDVVVHWGIGPRELFEGIDIGLTDLEDPHAYVSIPVVDQLASRARELTGEPALGIAMGNQMRVSAHGYLGFAAMVASNIREALELAVRYAPTRTDVLSLRTCIEGDRCAVIIDEDIGYPAARELIVMSLVVGLRQIGCALTGVSVEGSADFAFPAPAGLDLNVGPAVLARFDQPTHQLLFDSSVLDLPIVSSDSAARRLAQEQCERELHALGSCDDLVREVTALMTRDKSGFRSLEDVAERVGMSPRSLKRRLAERHTSYSTLLDRQKRDRALLLLRSDLLSLEAIAEQLDYSDVANFARAFRRWTGVTPGAFRKGLRSR